MSANRNGYGPIMKWSGRVAITGSAARLRDINGNPAFCDVVSIIDTPCIRAAGVLVGTMPCPCGVLHGPSRVGLCAGHIGITALLIHEECGAKIVWTEPIRLAPLMWFPELGEFRREWPREPGAVAGQGASHAGNTANSPFGDIDLRSL